MHVLPIHLRALALLALAGCGSAALPPPAPAFAPARQGVFVAPVPLVDSTNDDLMPALALTAPRIVYVAKAQGNLDLFTRELPGGRAVRLTTHSTDDTDPALAPNGEAIVWASQSDDVKGDIWWMDADGDGKRRLTGSDTADAAPVFGPTGDTVYFTSRAAESLVDRIDVIELDQGTRRTVVDLGWDPAISTDGQTLFYAALDERKRPRLYAKQLATGRVAALTDGVAIEGMPRVAPGAPSSIYFARYADDTTTDGVADANDAASLWLTTFDPALFEGAPPTPPRPLTAGHGAELFAAAASNFVAFTSAASTDLDILALPPTGLIAQGAAPEAILEAARAEDDAALRRLALRTLIVTNPGSSGSAHYELARDLVERTRFLEAAAEFGRAAELLGETPQAALARLEAARASLLHALGGRWVAREQSAQRAMKDAREAMSTAVGGFARHATVVTRTALFEAELLLASGGRGDAARRLEAIAREPSVSSEDGARALELLSELYARLGDARGVARTCQGLLERFSAERAAARRCAERWVTQTVASPGVPALAALEELVREHEQLPTVAAAASAALANAQAALGFDELATAAWRRLVERYPAERAVLSKALLTLAEGAEKRREQSTALEAYEQLLVRFPDEPGLRSRAKAGITRLRLAQAQQEEARGARADARASYARLLENDENIVVAHRRMIALAAEDGVLEPLLTRYRATAKAQPANKMARYAFGYALTFATPLPLGEAEREVQAALVLDPRFAPAHLTLGWLRLQREQREPGREWLERALSSFAAARELADPEAEPTIWAAAQLNQGNALLELGKTDDALQAFLAREQLRVPFENPLTELLFFEAFARTAWREGELDLAVHMAKLGLERSATIPNSPRNAPLTALLGAVHLQAEIPDEALRWLDRAATFYAERAEPARRVPLLRGRAMALELLGRADEALATYGEVLELVARGHGVVPPPDPLLKFLRQEIGPNPRSITRAPYGFTSSMEEELTRTLVKRVLARRGDHGPALDLDRRRLELLRLARSDERRGPRLTPELLYALHESARLHTEAGRFDTALERWSEALELAVSDAREAEAVTVLTSLQQLWTRVPSLRQPALVAQATRHATKLAESTTLPEPSRTALARWRALEAARVAVGLTAPTVATAPAPASLAKTVERALAVLDDRAAAYDEAVNHARAAQDPTLLRELALLDPAIAADPATSVPPTWRESFALGLATRSAAESSAEADPYFDAAVRSFEAANASPFAPERSAFIALAVRRLEEAKATERAWTLAERDRLQALAPSADRWVRDSLRVAMGKLEAARSDPAKLAQAVKTSPALARAFASIPATLEQLRAVLDGGVFVQAFALRGREWQWFVIGPTVLTGVVTEPLEGAELPPALAQALDAALAVPAGAAAPGRRPLFVDLGGLVSRSAWELTIGGVPLAQHLDVTEVPAATYLLAAREARNLSRAPAAVVDATVSDSASVARIVHGKLIAEVRPFLRSEGAQLGRREARWVLLGPAPQTPGAASLRLDIVAGESARAGAVIFVDPANEPSTRRAAALAMFSAGTPTVLFAPDVETAARLRTQLENRIASRRVAEVFAEGVLDGAWPTGTQLYGDRGMTYDDRVAYAYGELVALAGGAAKSFQQARAAQDVQLWHQANRQLQQLLDVVAFLLLPESTEKLAASKQAGAAAVAKVLPMRALQLREQLAQTMVALGDYRGAAELQRALIGAYQQVAKPEASLEQLVALGRTLATGKLHAEADTVLRECAELAEKQGATLIEADCRSRWASTRRTLFDYELARQQYERSIRLYASKQHGNEIYPTRFLGFLYESALADYEKAHAQFARAYELATKHGEKKLLPALLLDRARVYRQQANYAAAIETVSAAEAALLPESADERAEAALEAAKVHWYRGNYRRALDRQQRALDLAQLSGNTFQQIQALSLAGLIALNQGELSSAERWIVSALELSRATDRRSEQATQWNNLGLVYQRAGRLDEAVKVFRDALAIDTELASLEGRAYDLRNLAGALRLAGDYPAALAHVTEALEASRKIGNRFNELNSLFVQGEVLMAMQRAPQASEAFVQAAALAVDLAVPEVEWRARYALGQLALAQDDTQRARARLSEALEVAERLGRGRSESATGPTREDLYADAIALAHRAGDTEGVHRLLERERARGLLDLITSRTIELDSPEARGLLEREIKARELVFAAKRDVARKVPGAEQALAAAESAHELATRAFVEREPRLARAFLIRPAHLAELQRALDEGTAVVSYFVSRKLTLALVVTSRSATTVALPTSSEVLASGVERVLRELDAFAPVTQSLALLGEHLLRPLAETLGSARHWVFVPHGMLHQVPFAALTLEGKPLVEKVVVTEALSLSLLADTLRRARPTSPRSVVAVARGEDLPFAQLEARAVSSLPALLGAEARESVVRTTRADALALAVHAELDAKDPLASALVLEPGPGDDGRLEAREVFGLRGLPRLVTLSACSTLGSLGVAANSVDARLSLAAAFHTAGADTVLASRGRISDLAAAILMKRFYRELAAHPAGDALRRAMLWTRSSFAHPGHWARIGLLGDYR